MAIISPDTVIDFATRDEMDVYFRVQRNRMALALQNREVSVPSDQQHAVIAFLEEATDIQLTAEQLVALFDLYPLARIQAAAYGIDDTDTRDRLAEMAADFFLGCTWPTREDQVDIDVFLAVLKAQATKMGFTVIESV